MNHHITFGKPTDYNYDILLDQFSNTKINSVKTSSVPLVQFWKDTKDRLSRLQKALGVSFADDIHICFEYPTASRGRARSSMTDLMILSGESKIAIEAKFTEYKEIPEETVTDWLQKGKSPKHREKVLDHWWTMITRFRQSDETKKSNEIEYQFLHRTASACFGFETKQAVVIYQIFYDEETLPALAKYKERLSKYVRLIDPNENLKFYTWEIEAKLKESPESYKARKNQIFTEMKGGDIYEFREQKWSSLTSF